MGSCLAQAEKTAARHSSNLLRLCDEVLNAANITVAGLGAVACGHGPGSFTGLRVGLAVAKGLALPNGTSLVLVSSLEALAADLACEAKPGALLVPCIDAGKSEVYVRFFLLGAAGPEPHGDELTLSPANVCAMILEKKASAPVLLGGNGADRYLEVFQAALDPGSVRVHTPGPSALSIGKQALARLARGEADDLATAVPSYGRGPDITRPKPRQGLGPLPGPNAS
jgi:tRNA threonylcarbamoyladenosine biosynthesis protein TsaB